MAPPSGTKNPIEKFTNTTNHPDHNQFLKLIIKLIIVNYILFRHESSNITVPL